MASGLKKFDIDPANLDADGIAENQTLVGAGNLTLNGALCDLGTAGQFDIGDAYSDGIAGVKILIDSAGDISGVTFTVTGKDQDGNSITEDITGVTTTAVSSNNYWSQITQIAADGAVGSNVFVGTVTGELATKTIPVNRDSTVGAAVAVSGLTGTCQFDLQQTFEDLSSVSGINVGWIDVLSNQTANVAGSATIGATGVRLKLDSYSDGAELQFHVSFNQFK